MTYDVISSGILDVDYFEAEVLRALHNKTGGLRNFVNNSGIIVGNTIRFPLVDDDGMAELENTGSPSNPDQLLADTSTATILAYEASTMLSHYNLNSTNSAAQLRAAAATKVVNKMERRATDLILTALSNYDDTNMEYGSSSVDFDVDSFADLDYIARKYSWGDYGRMLLLPPQAENTLKKDEKFYEIWSLRNGGKAMVDGIPTPEDDRIVFYPYGKWNVGFMGQKGSGNVTGLPATADSAATGYAWLMPRVGFGMNQEMNARVFEDETKQGNPLVFKTNGAMVSVLIDTQGVIGIKLDGTEPA